MVDALQREDDVGAFKETVMATEFRFDIATDFPNGRVDASVLTAEIEGSSIGSESGAMLVGITLEATGGGGGFPPPGGDPDTAIIEFDEDLTTNEEVTLSTIVGSHRGDPFVDGVQRETALGERVTATSDYSDLVAAVLESGELEGGEYTLSVSFELAVSTANNTSGAQVQVRFNGMEVASAASALQVYDLRSVSQPVALRSGDSPVIDVRCRRVGTANTAKVRRVRISLAPAVNDEEVQ